jgi:hypothetical protein
MTLFIKPTLRQDTPTGEVETWYEVWDEANNVIVCKDTRKGAEAVVQQLERESMSKQAYLYQDDE